MRRAEVVCPACHGPLSVDDGGASVCDVCHAAYPAEAGRPVLLVPGDLRFDDALDCCLLSDEERTNAFTTKSYHLPLLRRLLGSGFAGASVLSAGCGVGVDVDLYCDAGLDAHGVDCGSRVEAWPRRRHADRFEIGSVTHLPYPDGAFDAVITGCLLPHIGVVGDSAQLRADGAAERRAVAAELLRVVRPGGHVVMGNPNRLCPADLFHKGQMAGPDSLVRWHGPREPFLLSFADYEALFGGGARLEALPVSGYWGFHSKEAQPATRLLARGAQGLFRAAVAAALRLAAPLGRQSLADGAGDQAGNHAGGGGWTGGVTRIAIFPVMAGRSGGGPETYERELVQGIAALDGDTDYRLTCLNAAAARALDPARPNFRSHLLPGGLRPVAMTLGLPLVLRREKIDFMHAAYIAPPWSPVRYMFTLHCSSPFAAPDLFPPLIPRAPALSDRSRQCARPSTSCASRATCSSGRATITVFPKSG